MICNLPHLEVSTSVFDKKKLAETRKRRQKWEKNTVPNWIKRHPERRKDFETVSGVPVRRLYAPEDIKGMDYYEDLGFPGE